MKTMDREGGTAMAVVFDPAQHEAAKCQGLLSQLVTPRPIAMISTADADRLPNVAPFSYYMPITGKPMLVAVTMGLRESDAQPKHTFENATRSGDFVINVTTAELRDHIETAAIEFPRGTSELDSVPWTVVASQRVSSPSIAESPAHLECEVRQVIPLGDAEITFSRVNLVIAEVVCVVLDDAICNADYRVDTHGLRVIGRMGFPWFTEAARDDAMFELPRYSYEELVRSQHKGGS
jgi:flavin reductase (DIM6/NTAB) family NADH-FMN oxidoreductase RutF